ncbi:hypothetical protein HY772_06375 [Candidatus Woesearchaeota archaeon]|nr:hypothetical protein [Candidatus Woesearchaeota archaeon]
MQLARRSVATLLNKYLVFYLAFVTVIHYSLHDRHHSATLRVSSLNFRHSQLVIDVSGRIIQPQEITEFGEAAVLIVLAVILAKLLYLRS